MLREGEALGLAEGAGLCVGDADGCNERVGVVEGRVLEVGLDDDVGFAVGASVVG